jgi:hypothetical protein
VDSFAPARSALRAFGFAEFLSPIPNRLKSPQGEGESFPVFLKFARLELPDGHSQNQNRPAAISSLGGEDKR